MATPILTPANIQTLLNALPILAQFTNGIPGSLIVPGTITANQIAAGSILASHYGSQSIVPGAVQQGAVNNAAAVSMVAGPFTVGHLGGDVYGTYLTIPTASVTLNIQNPLDVVLVELIAFISYTNWNSTDETLVSILQSSDDIFTTTTDATDTLPVSPLNVASTTNFTTPSGALLVNGSQYITYTGTTSTSFTGTAGGTGTITAGTTVTQASILDTIDTMASSGAGFQTTGQAKASVFRWFNPGLSGTTTFTPEILANNNSGATGANRISFSLSALTFNVIELMA